MRRLTDGNNVEEISKFAKVEVPSLDLPAARKHADGNWSGIRGRQANDTDTGKGVEGGRGAKVDETKHNLHHHAEHHGVERHVEPVVDLHPPFGSRDGAIPRKGPGAARRGRGNPDAAEQGEDHEGNEQANSTA